MQLLDTSYWIEFLKGNKLYRSQVEIKLNDGLVIGFSPIFGELLQGCKTKRESDIIMAYWDAIPKSIEKDSWIAAGQLSSKHKLFTRGLGLVDVAILSFAISGGHTLHSLDKKLMKEWRRLAK